LHFQQVFLEIQLSPIIYIKCYKIIHFFSFKNINIFLNLLDENFFKFWLLKEFSIQYQETATFAISNIPLEPVYKYF